MPGGDAGANIEALSSVSRTLNFRLTVRDNHAFSSTAPIAVGQTAFADAVVTVSNLSGPFAVTAPNTAVTWTSGAAVNVTWSVNGTTAAPVSCANVNILLSTDGGLTFPTVLAASTANDGAETITVPSANSTTCRVKVEAVGNIFFDISNANFTIAPAFTGNTTSVSADNRLIASPNPASSVVNLEFKADGSNAVLVTVTNQSGAIVLQRNIAATKGLNKKMLDINSLRSGIYTINISEGTNLKSTKIIVSK